MPAEFAIQSAPTMVASTNGQIWGGWNYVYTTTTGSITANTITGGSITIDGWVTWNTAYVETAEQREARERNNADIRRQFEEQQAAHDQRVREAQQHASELLNELLSDEQRQTWAEHNWFLVRGSASGRLYRIRSGCVNNVDRMTEDESRPDLHLCAHPPGLPNADINLAQMLLLVTDEDAFLRVANSHTVREEDAEPVTANTITGAQIITGALDHEPAYEPHLRAVA